MHFNPGINNKKWQFILIPLLALVVSVLVTYNGDSRAGQFYFPWRLFVTLCIFTFFTWQANLITYVFLDKCMTFYDDPGKRLLVQILSCILATWITFALLYLLSLIIQGGGIENFSPRNFFFFLLVATGISFIINSLYFIRYLQSTVSYKEAISTQKMNDLLTALEQKKTFPSTEIIAAVEKKVAAPAAMVVESGAKTTQVRFDEMAYWYSSEGLVILVKVDEKKMSTNFSSFNAFAEKLPGDIFFQLSRQFITHLQSIVSITDDSNRKLVVQLAANKSTNKTEKVSVSRYRSQELKRWFAAQLAKSD